MNDLETKFQGSAPSIKFTYEFSVENIPILCLRVGLKDGKIPTDLHVKPADRNQYSSAHRNHAKRSVVFSQTLRISRLCSNESDFERNKENEAMISKERIFRKPDRF